MEMSPLIEKTILKYPVESQIWKVAREQGMLTMKDDAMIKAFNREVPFSDVNLLSGLLMEDDIPTTVEESKKENVNDNASEGSVEN